MEELKQEMALLQKKLKIAEEALKEMSALPVSNISTGITYKEFERAISDLKSFFKEQEKLDAVLKVISPTSTGVCEFGHSFIDAFIRLGEAALKDEYNWLSWFVFDNEFGAKKLTVSFDGKDYTIANEKDFYDALVKFQLR